MAILTRICRLFAADVHGILDSLEAPDVMLSHAIREMEEAIAEKEAAARDVEYCTKQVQKAIDARTATLTEQTERISLCFAEGNEDLAKRFVRRRLETEQALGRLREQKAHLDERAATIATDLDSARETLTEVQEKAALLQATSAASTGPVESGAISEEEVEVAFIRAKRAAQQPAEVA